MRQVVLIGFIVLFQSSGRAFGDMIHLKSGEVVEGRVVSCDTLGGHMETCITGRFPLRVIQEADITQVEKLPPTEATLSKPDQWSQWGGHESGVSLQLVTNNATVSIGQPMEVSLLLKNNSETPKASVAKVSTDYLIIKDAYGMGVRRKDKILGQWISVIQSTNMLVDPGEIVALLEGCDLTRVYVITTPGRYSVQFANTSNIVYIDVQPGSPQPEDALIAAIAKVLPDAHWDLSPMSKDSQVPEGGAIAKWVGIELFWEASQFEKGETVQVGVWLTQEAAAPTSNMWGWTSKTAPPIRLLGRYGAGYVYAGIPERANQIWPSITKDLQAALSLQ